MSTSLADDAVSALAAVRRMDDGVELEHDERHQVRSLKRYAEQTLAEAFHRAQELAFLASDIRKLGDERRKGCGDCANPVNGRCVDCHDPAGARAAAALEALEDSDIPAAAAILKTLLRAPAVPPGGEGA